MTADSNSHAEILLIEPSRLYREILFNHINLANLSSDWVENASQAVNRVSTTQYQLILCAAELKSIKGIELVKQLRAIIGENTPILLITTTHEKKTVSQAFKFGVTEVISRSSLVELQYYFNRIFDAKQQQPFQKGNVLCVEDSRPISNLIKAVLEEEGHQVETLASAEKALERLNRDPKFDLVITDILLEGKMTGIGLIREIKKASAELNRIPMLAISGLDNIDQKLEALRQGASDFISKPINFEELTVRVRNLITAKLLYDKVIAQERELRKMAVTDPLTGLYNRHYLSEVGIKRVDEARRHHHQLSVIIVDIDHFKKVNDSYGHAAGDSVLKQVGTLLRESCRSEDFAVRFGGEEFVLVLPHCDKHNAKEKAEQLRQEVRALEPDNICITASFGVSAFDSQSNTQSFSQLFQLADEAVYYSKEHGRDQVTVAAD